MPLLSNTVTAERTIPAPPERIFALLSDPARHRDIDGSGTLRDAAGGSQQLGLGSRFGMDMKAGIGYRMVNEVVEFEQDRRIAWQARPDVKGVQRLVGGRIWRYELEPVEGGTRVRETWDISQEVVKPLVWPVRGLTRISMERTLRRIEELVSR